MKVKVLVEAILETDTISNRVVKYAIERAVLNKTKDNLAEIWAVDEVDRSTTSQQITLELM